MVGNMVTLMVRVKITIRAGVIVKIMIGDRVMCIYLGFRVIDRLGLE